MTSTDATDGSSATGASDANDATRDRDRGGQQAEIRLSNGMAVAVREAPERVLAVLTAAYSGDGPAFVTLTRENGDAVHLAARHIVMIEPRAAAGVG